MELENFPPLRMGFTNPYYQEIYEISLILCAIKNAQDVPIETQIELDHLWDLLEKRWWEIYRKLQQEQLSELINELDLDKSI